MLQDTLKYKRKRKKQKKRNTILFTSLVNTGLFVTKKRKKLKYFVPKIHIFHILIIFKFRGQGHFKTWIKEHPNAKIR